MTTATLSTIRTAAVTTLTNAVSGVTFYPRRPLRFQTPGCYLRRVSGPIWRTMGSTASVQFELVLIVAFNLADRASEQLDTFVEASGSASIRGALEAARTLGGVVDSLDVGEWGEEELIDENDTPYPGTTLPLEVYYR